MPDDAATDWTLIAPRAGWVRVRAVIRSSIPSVAALALDCGNGFEREGRLELAAVDGPTRIDRILRLPRGVRRVRLEPICHPGHATVESFSVQPKAAIIVHTGALLANLRRALGGSGAGHRPSLWLGVKLLLGGEWDRFRLQMVTNAQAAAAASAYDAWQRRHALTDADRDRLRSLQSTWLQRPLISVLLPVYNVDEPYLRGAIDSVLRQLYPHWELCIADDASPHPHVRRVLEAYAASEPRIRLVFRTQNGNISAASNSALELATGPYVALLDHDDVLAEHALHAMAAAIVADPKADLLYSDEDKISADGAARSEPFFKPDWSPEYLLSCMYPCHLSVIRTELIRRLGSFRSAYDSAQDYDLALRILSAGAAVRHVPDILYHWRAIASSAASGASAKPAAHRRAQAALADHLQRLGRAGTIEPATGEGYHRIRFQLRSTPRVSAIIPTAGASISTGGRLFRRRSWAVLRCVASLHRRNIYPNLEIVLVEQRELEPALIRELARHDVRRIPAPSAAAGEPLNRSAAINHGVAAATGEQMLLLHEDVELISPDAIQAMLEYAQWPEIGAVGAKLLGGDGTLCHVGVTLVDGIPTVPFAGAGASEPGPFFAAQVVRNWSAVSGACLLSSRAAFEAVHGFDADRFPDRFGDVDYCLRLQADAGRRIVSVPFVTLYDQGGAADGSAKIADDGSALERFRATWSDRLPLDPYYNPNLTTRGSDFGVG